LYKKILIGVLLFIIIFCSMVLVLFRDTVFQEGNPIPILTGIITIELTDKQVVPLKEGNQKFILRASNYRARIVEYLSQDGFSQHEGDVGGGMHQLEKDDKIYYYDIRMFTRNYVIYDLIRVRNN